MGIFTKIAYSDSTINEFRGCEGCELWNPKAGVKVCYAGRMISRFAGKHNGVWPEEFTKPIRVPGQIMKAIGWKDLTGTDRGPDKPWLKGYPRVIFINDMSDSFMNHIWVDGVKTPLPVDWLSDLMPAMIASPHIFMFLTKRARRAVKFFGDIWGSVPKNFWIGTTITSGATLPRATELAKLAPICQGKLWISVEPLYNDVRLVDHLPSFDWVAVGGESGPGAAKTELSDIVQIIEDCEQTSTSVFVKQLGSGYGPKKGEDWNDWPVDLRRRQMPTKI